MRVEMTFTPRMLLTDGTVRRLVLQVFAEVRQGWPFLTDVLSRAFKDSRVPDEMRGQVTDMVHDLVRMHRKVEYALGPDADELSRLGATLALTGAVSLEDVRTGMGLPLEGLTGLQARIDAEGDAAVRLGLTHSLPDWLAQRLLDELGAERANTLAAALNQPAPQTLRVNTLRAHRDDVLAELGAAGIPALPTLRAPAGITLATRINVFTLPAFADGRVEVQDEASQLVCEVVAPPPGGTVVDACAGAGGKTLGLAALLGNKGRIVALDPSGRRIGELKRRAARAQVFNVQAHKYRAGEEVPPVVRELEGRAERVLVDAPCSGLGALRRNPEARWRVQPDDVERLRAQQLEIATQAARWVKPGGRLIYATCTFLRAECEDVVEKLRAAVPGLEPVRVREVLGGARTTGITDEQGMYLRTWPDLHGMDGFFAAVLRRKA
ncbi:MAG: RsmB/NOP family class I SAM-dependent RNA methyltransferase [Myxococcota bacterium]